MTVCLVVCLQTQNKEVKIIPRVWGQGKALKRTPASSRIIPTRVGTSSFFCVEVFNCEDHPHACGDKSYAVALASSTPGSSPRVWGQVVDASFDVVPMRIIPTRVGTSFLGKAEKLYITDHPHAYGDKVSIGIRISDKDGSSPRVWGQAEQIDCSDHSPRIIPTRVGTSSVVCSYSPDVEDHPHACGDKTVDCVYNVCKRQSSPRVWGQDGGRVHRGSQDRIIPTRMGTRK